MANKGSSGNIVPEFAHKIKEKRPGRNNLNSSHLTKYWQEHDLPEFLDNEDGSDDD